MANFEIKDCVHLRAMAWILAHDAALKMVYKGYPCDIVETANEAFNYIKGDADIPEYISPNHEMDRYLDVFKEVSKNTSSSATNFWWIKPKDLLPPVGTEVLVIYSDEFSDNNRCFGKYQGDNFWEAYPADMLLSTKADNIKVLAWCPIPEYKSQQYGRNILDSENRHDV